MSVRESQERFSRLLQFAQRRAIEKDYEASRRALLCAAAQMLQIAEEASIAAKPKIEEKAISLIKGSVRISQESFETIFPDINKPDLGCGFELIGTGKPSNTVTFDQVVGLEDVKDVIRRQIINPKKYSSIYDRYHKKPGGGILLYGLPGTGKTMIAKAIANEIDAEFIPIRCSDIMSKWFGESENKIKDLFARARKSILSIIFFDEFEAIGMQRGDGSEAMNRIVPELLSQIQGMEDSSNIIVICATNRPWDIDGAFMRPGRLTNRIYVPLPDEAARLQMLENALVDVPLEKDWDITKVLAITNGYSGADIEELCDFAKNFAIEREINEKKESVLYMDDVFKAAHIVKPSIREFDFKEMEAYRNQFNNTTINTYKGGNV